MGVDMYTVLSNVFAPVIDYIFSIIRFIAFLFVVCIVIFLVFFCLRFRINPLKVTRRQLAVLKVRWFPYNILRWLWHDFILRKTLSQEFGEYGFSIFCGRQGAGKTISMVDYLNNIHEIYPRCKIVTNFKYIHADKRLESWRDLLEYRNGVDGVVFAIDEIHSEYSSESWKDFPENLLSEISQQRKQRVKIIASSQVFGRVVKQIREQTFSVMICKTYFRRITHVKEYDAAEYSTSDTPYQVKKKIKPISSRWFVQSNYLRACYDTYEKIERMQKIEFIPRNERH